MCSVPNAKSVSCCYSPAQRPFSGLFARYCFEWTVAKVKTELSKAFATWNRKIHYYLGLYLLFFVWLFAFSGLLLNNSSWKTFEFWDKRKESTDERPITNPPSGSGIAQANELMRQLGISGEVEWTTSRANNNALNFRVTRPGHVIDINADFQQKQATIKRIDYNAWGLIRTLHTFTGDSAQDNRNQRDWILTKVWAFAMDAVAVGLIIMVL